MRILALSALSALGSLLFAPTASAQTPAPNPGAKATLTFSFTLTEEIGGYLIKTLRTATTSDEYGNVRNPHGFDPINSLTAAQLVKYSEQNYYVIRYNPIKYRNYNGEPYPTEIATDYLLKLLSTKYSNKEFLLDLVTREVIPRTATQTPGQAIAGYALVIVEIPNDTPRPDMAIFVEKKNSPPIYVGSAPFSDTNTANDFITVDLFSVVEGYTTREVDKLAYDITELGVEQNFARSSNSVSEKFNGQVEARMLINRPDDSFITGFGNLKFSGTYSQARNYADSKGYAGTLQGYADKYDAETDAYENYALTAGTLSTSAFTFLPDISAYRAAIPPPPTPPEL
jgi:hypothetical protein